MKIALYLLLVLAARAAPWLREVNVNERASVAAQWREILPSGRAAEVRGTSMLPLIHEGDWALQEAYVGQPLEHEVVRAIVTVKGDTRLHYVYDENKTHVFLTGINNRRSDGWIDKSKITHVLIGILRVEEIP